MVNSKFILAALLLACTAAAVTGCAGKNSELSSESTAETAPTDPPIIDPNGNVLAEKPTERERDIVENGEFDFEIQDGGAVITAYNGYAEDVVIPDTLGGAPVTEIGYYSFEAKWDMKSVTLPDSVTTIGEFCFSDCSSLESVNIPQGVTGIERGAFAACTSLTEITVPAAVQFINEEAFTACESLVSLTIENPAVQYESWGLEELPEVTVYAPEGAAILQWAQANGINAAAL